MMNYKDIKPIGSDTGAPLNLQRRINLILQLCEIRSRQVLDCGCGTGQYLIGLLQNGADVLGIEYSEDKVQEFHRNYPEFANRVKVGNIEQMNFSNSTFDVVLLNEVLEHIPDQNKGLKEIRRVLKPNGLCVIFSPNRLYPFETHGVTLKMNQKVLPYATPFIPYIPVSLGNFIFDYHARNYWPYELRNLLIKEGFKIASTKYVWQTFEGISGKQPFIIAKARTAFRKLASFLETIPIIQSFGISQMVIAEKSD